MHNKAVVLLSGGMDSATLLARLRYEEYECVALSVHYSQRHARELIAAQRVAQHYHTKWEHINLGGDFGLAGKLLSGSALTSSAVPVPHGRYDDESMKITIVPNRNMLFLAMAGAYAISNGIGCVAYANHAGDHAIYPDCRPLFVQHMRQAFEIIGIELRAPYTNYKKHDIALQGKSLRVPYELTYSCYEGRELHCGLCGTCVERIEAFKMAEMPDPTRYEK